MTDGPHAPAAPSDPGLAGVPGLFREGGAAILGPFLEARGWSLGEARPVQAMYRPHRSLAVRYRVRGMNRRGEPRVVTLCAETRHRPGRVVEPAPGLGERYGLPEPVQRTGPHLVWAFPYDPSLAGLPEAAWGPSVRDRLAAAGRPLRAVSVQPLRYRPRRRAVFRYTGLHGGLRGPRPEPLFGKVLRSSGTGRWPRVRGSRGIRLPVPLAATNEGPLLFAPLEGRSLRQLLLAGGSLPGPGRVAELLDRLPEALAAPPPREGGPDALRTATATRELVTRLVPGAAPAADRVLEAVARGLSTDRVPQRLVHGDLYEAQVFVADDYGLGLIDLDDLGPGDPAMDAANFCAHLVALAMAVPQARDRLMAYRGLVRRAFMDRLGVGPTEMGWREGLCMLALATGPFRVLSPRWPAEVGARADLAVRLMEAA